MKIKNEPVFNYFVEYLNPKIEKLIIFFKRKFMSGKLIYRLGVYILLLDIAFVFMFPFLYMIITSLKTLEDLFDITVNWIPNSLQWSNYVLAFNLLKYPHHFKNSLFMTIISTIGHLLSCSFIAYGFARFQFRSKNFFFTLVILTIIIPVQVIIIPLYVQYAKIKWVNTYLPLLVPTFFGFGLRGGLFIFIFRQFFLGLPPALEDAARIDGCNFVKTYWKIVLPISKPAILVCSILSMVWHWNDYYEPIIYLGKPSLLPLPSMLPSIYETFKKVVDTLESAKTTTMVTEGVVMAATFLVVAPLLIVYIFLQRQFVEGIERTGLVE
jgi:multiple sugar transport system permease protein